MRRRSPLGALWALWGGGELRTTYFSSSSNILAQRGERRNVSVNEESFASIAFFFRSGSLNEDDNGRDEE